MTITVTMEDVSKKTFSIKINVNTGNSYGEESNAININDGRNMIQAMYSRILTDNKTCFRYFVKISNTRKNETLIFLFHQSDCKNYFKADDEWHSIAQLDINNSSTYIINVNFTIRLAANMSYYKSLYQDTQLTDFELRGVDGSVHMHKAVAAAHSPYFITLFSGEWLEKESGVVDAPDTSQTTLQYLKDYMYLGKVPESDDLKELLLLSSLYMLPDLEMQCVYLLSTCATTKTAYDLIEFAITHKMSKLVFEMLVMVQSGRLNVNDMKKLHTRGLRPKIC